MTGINVSFGLFLLVCLVLFPSFLWQCLIHVALFLVFLAAVFVIGLLGTYAQAFVRYIGSLY